MAEAALREIPKVAPEVVLRPSTGADVTQLIQLARTALGEGVIPRTEAFWRWKHEDNPFGASPAMVAEADERIVSMRVFLRWRWRYGERTFEAVRPVDTATHPDWRRRGLFERLTRALLDAMRAEGMAFLFNTPNARSGQGYQKLGWRVVGRPAIWVRPVRPLRMVTSLVGRAERPDGAPSPKGQAAPSTAPLGSPDLAGFLQRVRRNASRLTTDADAAYLGWRYGECPGLAYGVAGAFDRTSGALVAFRETLRQGLRELRLCDLFVSRDGASRGKAQEVIRELLRDHDVDLVTARAVPRTPEASVLLRSGFVPVPRIGPILAVRPLREGADLPALGRLSTWGASIGDVEVF